MWLIRGRIQDFEGDPAEPTGHENRWSTETIEEWSRTSIPVPIRTLHLQYRTSCTAHMQPAAALCSTHAAPSTAVAAPMIKPKSSLDCTCSPCATYKLDL